MRKRAMRPMVAPSFGGEYSRRVAASESEVVGVRFLSEIRGGYDSCEAPTADAGSGRVRHRAMAEGGGGATHCSAEAVPYYVGCGVCACVRM